LRHPEIGDFLGGRALDDRRDEISHLGQQLDALLAGQKTSGDDIGRGLHSAGLLVDGNHRDHDPPGGEMLAVPEHDVTHVSQTASVDEDPSRLLPPVDPPAMIIEGDDVAVLGEENPLAGNSEVAGDPRVIDQLPPLSVDGNEIARTDQIQHQLELFHASMPGNVDRRDGSVVDLRSPAVKVIDDPGHRSFVSGNDPGGENHGVARVEARVLVVVHRDLRHGRKGLALASGGEHQQLIRGQGANLGSSKGCTTDRSEAV
jgi:hypothetical protein